MFAAFNISQFRVFDDDIYYSIGQKYYAEINDGIHSLLDTYLASDGTLKAENIMADWFPQLDCNVFISHSHKDEKDAIKLSGWLQEKFSLKPFVDSCVWGYANKLLKEIDDRYCATGENLYSYDKRNKTTEHVHLMLMNALTKMIDTCECVFFLNSPNAAYSSENLEDRTLSPWIFSELAAVRTIRIRFPKRLPLRVFSVEKLNESVFNKEIFSYLLDLNKLIPLSAETMLNWRNKGKTGESALDALYELKRDTLKYFIQHYGK